jgi:hypothetical protein
MVKKELIITSLKYGLVGGILIVTPFFVLLKLGESPLLNLNTLILEGMLMFIFIYIGLREFRDRHNGGLLKFWEGMTIGFMIYLGMALVSTIIMALYIFGIDQEYVITYRQEAIEYINDSLKRISDEEEREALSNQLTRVSETEASDLVFDSLSKKILLGLALTPIGTVILRKYK